MDPEVMGRFLVTAFFAVVFLQSALDKLTDSAGNLEFLAGHFKNSPFPPAMVTRMFWILTALEALAGVLCGLGIVFFSFTRAGVNLASLGLTVSGLALLALITGQRFAKDYAGAAVVAAYVAVDLVGLLFFA
ncbi:DoxX family protein [bacterium]|nr:DoxX family protein [bacterium]